MNESQMRGLAQIARERVKDEAFYKTETGHALDLTKTREIIMDTLQQYKAELHSEVAHVLELDYVVSEERLIGAELAWHKLLEKKVDKEVKRAIKDYKASLLSQIEEMKKDTRNINDGAYQYKAGYNSSLEDIKKKI
jgi:hypothetical protein